MQPFRTVAFTLRIYEKIRPTAPGADKEHRELSLSINPEIRFCGGNAAFFVFPATCAAEKHIVSEKPPNKRFFKGTGVVLAGIERSQKSLIFASGIPVGERVDFFDTLSSRCG